jgi:hypothetical protein
MIRKLFLILFALLILAAGYGIYHFFFNDGTVRVTITREMIDDALEKKFPKQDTYAKVLHVHYENPIVEMIPGRDRVRIALDVRTELGLPGVLSKSYTGSATLTTSLGYAPESARFSLVKPELEELTLPGLAPQHLATLRQGMNLAAVLWFDDIPVHRIKDKSLKHRVTRQVLREVTIKNDRIIATLGLPKESQNP